MAIEINIREWQISDTEKILTSWLNFCRDAARGDTRLKPNSERVMKQWLLSRFRESSTLGLIAEVQHQYAGFLIGRIGKWDSSPPVLEPRKLGIIDAVFVSEPFRRSGVGTCLIERALQAMRDQNAVAAETTYDAGGDAPTALWRRAGFEAWMVHAHRSL